MHVQDQRGKLASTATNNDAVYSTLGEVRIQFELIYGHNPYGTVITTVSCV